MASDAGRTAGALESLANTIAAAYGSIFRDLLEEISFDESRLS